MMHKRYTKEQCTAAEAQRLAQEIAFGPVVFQVSRLMLKFGIFQLLSGKREGYTLQEISGRTGLTRYAAQVLLEASLTIGTILLEEDRYVLAKAGWFLLNDKMVSCVTMIRYLRWWRVRNISLSQLMIFRMHMAE